MSGEITGKPSLPDTVLAAPLDNGTGIALQFVAKGERGEVLLMDPAMAGSVMQAVATALSALPGDAAAKPPERIPALPVTAVAVKAAPGGQGCQMMVKVGSAFIGLTMSAELATKLHKQLGTAKKAG
jgi:hypothetical protein